jgi:hypothetical protein
MTMTGIEIWCLEDVWKGARKVQEFGKGVIGAPLTSANGACVKELGTTKRKEKLLGSVMK